MKASQAASSRREGIASRRLHKPACSRLGMNVWSASIAIKTDLRTGSLNLEFVRLLADAFTSFAFFCAKTTHHEIRIGELKWNEIAESSYAENRQSMTKEKAL